jgi:hypothetical protein
MPKRQRYAWHDFRYIFSNQKGLGNRANGSKTKRRTAGIDARLTERFMHAQRGFMRIPEKRTVQKVHEVSLALGTKRNPKKAQRVAELGMRESLIVLLRRKPLTAERLAWIAQRNPFTREFLTRLMINDFPQSSALRREIKVVLKLILFHNGIPELQGPSMRLGSPQARIQRRLFELEKNETRITPAVLMTVAGEGKGSLNETRRLFFRRKRLERTPSAAPKK